jgi:Family of unknown function (DUF6503)
VLVLAAVGLAFLTLPTPTAAAPFGVAAPSSQSPVERLPIIDQSIAFHGGELYRTSRTKLELCSGSGCYQLSVRVEGGLYEYRVTGPTSSGQRQVRVDNHSIDWWQAGVEQAVPPEREASLRDWAMSRIYFCFLPYRLNDAGVYKQDLGREAWDGRELRKVKVTFGQGVGTDAQDAYVYWLDPASGRIEQFAYSFVTGGPGLRFRRGFNYRRVGGLLFFDQQNLGVEGPGLTVDQIDPAFVAERMRPISTVELREISVGELDESP